jgi:hypothetical protein
LTFLAPSRSLRLERSSGESEAYGFRGDDKLEGRACDDEIYGGPCIGDTEGGDGDAGLYGGPGHDSTVADKVIADGPLEIADVFGR